jgi:deazaflavin-dependent oxidoreductase (nitroreductase family)
MDADLVAHGRVMRIEIRGRTTGEWRTATIGFVATGDGSYLVAANTGSKWGENLLADPACRVTVGDRTFDAVAMPLEGADHAHAVRELILRYGTPSEGLGRGPSFRLVPVREDRR